MGTADAEARPTRVRYLVLGWLCLAAALAYVHRAAIGVARAAIGADLDLTDQQLGYVMSAFFLGYSLFQIPGGLVGDWWGTRRALTGFVLIGSLATALMVAARPLEVLLADAGLGLGSLAAFFFLFTCWLTNGLAQAGYFPCSVNSFSKWFPVSQRALPNGLLGAFMSGGAVAASALTGLLLHHSWHWTSIFGLYALPGLLFGLGFYAWFRDRPREHPWVNAAEVELIEGPEPAAPAVSAGRPPTPWKTLLTSVRLGLLCGQQFFRAAGYIFYLTWLPTFLTETRGANIAESGFLTGFPLAGVVLGSLTGGVVMDWLLRTTGSRRLSRQGLAIVCLLGTSLFLLAAYSSPGAYATASLLAVGAFFAGLTGPAAYTVSIDLGGKHVATVFSIMNMGGNIGAFLLTIVAERLAAAWSWNIIPLFLASLYLSAVVCWALLDVEGSLFPEARSADTRLTAARD